jgi:TolB-like protein/class 3 adenylate cyclase/tetratricopeptide (TPR) repeat protein
LAAIFAADVAGYSRMMEQDEVATLRLLTACREVMDRLISEHGGRIANTAGDSVLAEFPSAVDAVQCAVEVQKGLATLNTGADPDRALRFRVGVHVGDVIVRGADLLGDGVNIAARLEALAEPGGVCISGDAYRQVRKALPLTFADLGPQQVKNLEEPVHALAWAPTATHTPSNFPPIQPKLLPLPDRPSIAVLPFTNMSGDPEQEYFADGLVEDIVTALSRVRWFFVIARNSSFTYKGRSVNLKQVGRELGVRYVVEGSVRRAGDRIRLTSQLIEAATGTHLWADRFDGSLADIFDFQDRITEGVVAAIEPSLRHAEIERARRKRPNSLDAYDLYLRAMPLAYANTTESSNEALGLLAEALKIDPHYAAAQAHAAWCYEQRYQRGGRNPEDKREAVRHARSVIASTTDDTLALAISGFIVGMLTLDYGAAVGAVDRALALNGNSALALGFAAMTEANAGLHDKALEHGMRAIHLSPLDPMNYHPYLGMGFAYFFSGRGEEAVTAAQRAIQVNPTFVISHAVLVASYAQLDEVDAAKRAADRLLDVAPGFTVSIMEEHEFTEPVKVAQFAAALRKAGLPN